MSEATQAPPATGTICWNEVLTSDAPAAVKFYTELCGWSTETMDMGPAGTYTLFTKDGTHIGGCMAKPADCDESQWLNYIAVDDVDASAKKAKSLGGTICMEPQDIPNIGRFAVITDPTGAAFGLFKGAGGAC